MSMYQVCIREVDKKSDRITPESGELTREGNSRPTPSITDPRQANWRRYPRTKHLLQPTQGKPTGEGNHLPTPISTNPRQANPRRKSRTKHLSQPTRGVGDLEGVPDTRSGGSVLEAPPGAEEGALPRERCPIRHLKQLTHRLAGHRHLGEFAHGTFGVA